MYVSTRLAQPFKFNSIGFKEFIAGAFRNYTDSFTCHCHSVLESEFPLDIFPPVTQSKTDRTGTVCTLGGGDECLMTDIYQTSSKHRRFFCC